MTNVGWVFDFVSNTQIRRIETQQQVIHYNTCVFLNWFL
jgi:hypothetical protein